MPESRTRQRLAEEAARIILEEGIRDYGQAKRKAADHLGITGRPDLPANTEIESAVLERNRLFASPGQRSEYIARLRAAALVMERLDPMETRLVGPLLLGIVEAAGGHQPAWLRRDGRRGHHRAWRPRHTVP
jgi:hypothetical protein